MRAVLSGLLVGLAFDIHPNDSLIYGPAIGALYLLDYGPRVLRAKRFWSFAAGAGAGLVFYVVMHVVPYPQTYLAMSRLVASSSRTPPILELKPGDWLRSLVDTAALLERFGVTRCVLASVAIVGLAWRPSAAARKANVLFAGLTLAFAALFRHKHDFYAILLSPAADLVLALWLGRLVRSRARAIVQADRRARHVVGLLLAVVSVFLVSDVADALPLMRQNPMADYEPLLGHVRQVVPPGSSVMGPQTYWFALTDRKYLSWENLIYYQRYIPGSTLTDALDALRPDVLIIDRDMEKFAIALDKAQLTSYGQVLHLPKGELDAFLAARAHMLSAIQTHTFGETRIYRIDWEHPGG